MRARFASNPGTVIASASPSPSSPASAERWLQRVGAVLRRHDPDLAAWSVSRTARGLAVAATVRGVAVTLEARAQDDAPRWLATRSLAINLDVAGDDTGCVAPFVERLRALLERSDPGALTLPPPPPPPTPRRDRAPAQRVRAALAEELRYAAYVAWRSMTSEDLYPHTRALGLVTPLEEIEAGWDRALARVRAGTAPDRLGLYVHIPFCAVECTFCFCGKTSRFGKGAIDDYVDTTVAEMARFGARFGGAPITSVYFGGGTPSILRPDLLERVFTALYASFNVPEGTQVIFEGNPDSLNAAKIAVLGGVGRVSRLTIGLQTLDPEAQRRAKRFNRPEHVRAAVEAARAHGIAHVNIDLMTGLDGQSMASFQDDLRFVLSLDPESVHLNPFRPARWSLFSQSGRAMSAEQFTLRDAMLRWGRDAIRAHGFGTQADHTPAKTANAANLQEYDLRQQNSSLLGFGIPARSHSFASHYYETDIHGDDIAGALEDDRRGVRRYRAIAVDDAEERHRFLVHNVRTGFSRAAFRDLFGCEPADVAPDGWQKLHDLGLIDEVGDAIVSHIRSVFDEHVHRVLLYGAYVRERVDAVWGPGYDPSVDYARRLSLLLEDDAPGGAGGPA